MENKKDLAKLALAALILASTAPVSSQAEIGAHGTFLAAGCAAHGCPAVTNDNNSNSNSGYYNPNANYNRESRIAEDNQANATNSRSSATLTESQLLDKLSPQGKSIYQSLSPEGKALAIQLASQDSYRDKDLAVKEAQRRINERRGASNR